SAAASAGVAPAVSRSRRRSRPSTSRTASVTRPRGTPASSAQPPSAPCSASTEGRPRSAAPAVVGRSARGLSARGKLGLHALLDAGDHLVGLAADRVGGHVGGDVGAEEPADGLLGETGPQLVEVARREALPAERARPLARQLLDEAVALLRQ